MQHVFIMSFGQFKPSVNFVKVNMTNDTTENYMPNVLNSQFDQQFDASGKQLLMSGDIELNPGPIPNNSNEVRLPSQILLEQRLGSFQLRPLDVGGAGDCFFELFRISYMVTQVIT